MCEAWNGKQGGIIEILDEDFMVDRCRHEDNLQFGVNFQEFAKLKAAARRGYVSDLRCAGRLRVLTDAVSLSVAPALLARSAALSLRSRRSSGHKILRLIGTGLALDTFCCNF